ncbi:undecaprenyl-diphosphate phosphatase [Acutalibacter muris]|jgi:undecaprenyl-diphosphatase|uniref:Undecaprenyl-diphosphatase n=1 Tax=Acutalibacter muris TaxID=1796620 RepID=A0A1Z2XQ44_9FIRM|nr:undecaprenyl-diphosphate phosphatase [Acutalibacter muris]ANU52805.1 UDP-diphosphatase [Hungateiclostridiaceae bacterium KB18]ASB40529.1 UDP-diphosphatase [Acutalibacter muris]MCI9544460.1 undecaprenyl-diphosphate phosphatase [Acutalibacter muris]QQR29813.1 undecaprenyl-diphosphate phosphatase [Acutalibacter muris]
MTIFDAILQGVIQGATEFLPVSSSGHLSISQHIFGIELPGILFDVMLHLGTLIAVVFVYRKLIWRLLKEFGLLIADLFRGRFKWGEMNGDRRLIFMLVIGLLPLFLLFLPIPGTDMKIKDLSEQLASDSSILVEGLALLATSLMLFLGILASRRTAASRAPGKHWARGAKAGRTQYTVADAVITGVTQCLAAVFPGLSRSGSTMSVGLMRGIDQQTALDYSFVLGIPSIAAAALLSIKDAGAEGEAIGTVTLIVGVITAAIVGFLAIKLLKWIVTTNKLSIFAVYTLIAGLAVTGIALYEMSTGQNLFTGKPL